MRMAARLMRANLDSQKKAVISEHVREQGISELLSVEFSIRICGPASTIMNHS